MLVVFIVQLLSAVKIKCQMDARIVNSDPVAIGRFTYSAFLFMRSPKGSFGCGSSIINQRILLTAAHCIDRCTNSRCANSTAFVGDTHKYRGTRMLLKDLIVHEHFNRSIVVNDIGLIATADQIELGDFVQRVSIVRSPPSFKGAAVAGWGLIDEVQKIHTKYLHYTEQRIWPLEECREIIDELPDGTFCGGEFLGQQYASKGDSGSALIVEDYIQLGIVSFKRPDITRGIVVYTDVPLFYDWIHLNARKLHCLHDVNSA